MPVDSRRLQGPETAFSYTLLEQKNNSDVEETGLPLLKAEGKRCDGRKPTDARPLCTKCHTFLLLILLVQIKLYLFLTCFKSYEDRSCQPSQRLCLH